MRLPWGIRNPALTLVSHCGMIPPAMTDRRQSILTALIDHLRYQRECGSITIALEPETVAVLAQLKRGARKPTRTTAPQPNAAQPLTIAALTPPARPKPLVADATAGLSAEAAQAALAEVATAIAACRKCILHQARTQVVPGQGNPRAPDVLFIGEAPGADEDRQGLSFVGAAGQLLTQMIAAMGYTREEVFIVNICKCRPPGDRQPTPDEMAACLPFLKEQIRILRPRTIVAMGNAAIQGLLGSSGMTRLQGIWASFEGIPLMPTYHPAYLLRFPSVKRDAWNDLKKVMTHLGRPIPPPAPKSPAATGGT